MSHVNNAKNFKICLIPHPIHRGARGGRKDGHGHYDGDRYIGVHRHTGRYVYPGGGISSGMHLKKTRGLRQGFLADAAEYAANIVMGRADGAATLFLAVLALFLCSFLWGGGRIFGSSADWISQHSVIPDYFRQQFYDTGQLFPQFALNLGGGQNIYNFSYYGLYNPVILVSYLLPFVKMGDYLMAAGVCSLMAAALLFYRWLRGRGVGRDTGFLTAVIFLLAGPMVYHSCKQVMFVNYMPFLCLAYLGVDRYFEKKKAGLFTLGVFLMIMTSFYFSIGGILSLVLYGVFRYFGIQDEAGEKVRIADFFAAGFRFLLPVFTAVLMSGILLAPTAFALMGGRGTGKQWDVGKLFWPDIHLFRILYSPYGAGLTVFALTVLITGLFYKKFYEKMLHAGCILIFTIPLFAWLLNGGLYIRDKVMIPFLPLLCYMIAYYMEKQRAGEISFSLGCGAFDLTVLLLYLNRRDVTNSRYWEYILLDGAVTAGCFLLYYALRKLSLWKRCYCILLLAPVVCLSLFFFFGIVEDGRKNMVDREFYEEVTDGRIKEAAEEIWQEDQGFYRMEQRGSSQEDKANINRIWDMGQYVTSMYSSSFHQGYQEFRGETFGLDQPFRNVLMQSAAKNPIYQKLMGVKYIVSKEEVLGYEKYKEAGDAAVYRREDVLPMAYVTDQVIGESACQALEFPYNQKVFSDYAVVEDKVDAAPAAGEDQETSAGKILQGIWALKTEFPQCSEKDFVMEKTGRGYHIKTSSRKNILIDIPESADPEKKEADTFFVQFDVKNNRKSKDVSVWVEEMENKLSADSHIYYNENSTFRYGMAIKPGTKKVCFGFGPGDYEIRNLRCFAGKLGSGAGKDGLCQSEVEIEKDRTKGNRITGSVDVEKEGYLITSIPFDRNFEVRLDGRKADVERVNTAFLGMKIETGRHEVEIIYHAPGFLAGKWMSFLGGMLFLFQWFFLGRLWGGPFFRQKAFFKHVPERV